jgi:hypothetical protein
VGGKARTLAQFYDFLVFRYQGDIHALTGHVLVQPIDEYNRPPNSGQQIIRVPPRDDEVEALFGWWRESLPQAPQVPARGAGLHPSVAVAPGGAADQRDGAPGHPGLAA